MTLDEVKAEAKRALGGVKYAQQVKGKALKVTVQNLTPQAGRVLMQRFVNLGGWEVTWSERNGKLEAAKMAR